MDALSKGRTCHPLPFTLRLGSLGSVILRSHETYTLCGSLVDDNR